MVTSALAAPSLAAGLLALSPAPARAAEVCRYAGMTSHSGRVAVRAEASEARGVTTLDVTARLDAKYLWFWTVQHLAQEISTWRAGELQSVAVNNRTIINGRPSRQQWDVFTRGPDGLMGSRVQSRSLPEFRRRHPAFAGHWDPGRFGEAWLPDYPAAQPKRRPDLDLAQAAMPPRMRTPYALAFYWSRWLPDAGGTAPVFMPGWKRDARLDAEVAPAAPQAAPGRWRMTLRHPGLDAAPSSAEAVVSADHQLLRLSFDVHVAAGSGQGWVDRTECRTR